MTAGWSWYVIALVTLNIAGCAWLLWWSSSRRPGDPKPEETSHVWDGDLTEYNKPMPRWWINLFYLTVIFAVGYLVYYPGLGAIAGSAKWTSAKEHDADKAKEDQKLALTFGKYDGMSIDALANDGCVHEARFHLARVPRKAQDRNIAALGLHEHASIACLNYTSYFEFHSIHLNGIA